MLCQMSHLVNTARAYPGEGSADINHGDNATSSPSSIGEATTDPVNVPHCNSPEIVAAAAYLATLLLPATDTDRVRQPDLEAQLRLVLAARYRSHWFSNSAARGSGYRSLLFGPGHVDAAVRQAVVEAGVDLADASRAIAAETTVWVDPGMVASRSGNSELLHSIYAAPGARDRSQSPGLRLSPKANAFTPASNPTKMISGLPGQLRSPGLDRRSKKPHLMNLPTPAPALQGHPIANNMTMSISPPPGLVSPPPGLMSTRTPPGLAMPVFLFNGVRA